MLKTVSRFIVVAVIALALGLLIYYLNQPTGAASLTTKFGGFARELGEGGFREGGFSLGRGMFGIIGDLILVAIVTVVVVSLQKAFAYKSEPARLR